MEEKSLRFPSVKEICNFLQETNRRNYVLLGKKLILIAPFSAEEVERAQTGFGANLTETVEAHLLDRKLNEATV